MFGRMRNRNARLGLRDLRGRGVLVTGASSGIGAALARRCGERGARVGLAARREAELSALAREIEQAGGEAHVLPCDLSEPAAAAGLVERANAALGGRGVELLVDNAGYGGHRRAVDWLLDDIERMTRLNHLAGVALSKAVLPAMLERGEGWIVFVASVAGKVATPLEAPYAATKAAKLAFAEALSCEVEDAGVHVMSVCPGVIDTPLFSPDDLAAMPDVARRGMVSPEALADRMLRGLARGERDLTFPGRIAASYPVKALLPGPFRRGVKRTTLGRKTSHG